MGCSGQRAYARSLVAGIAAVLLLVSTEAGATGVRVMGNWTLARDTSYDVFSDEDWREALDVSSSYTFLYPGRLFLLDVEGGYRYNPEKKDRLFSVYGTEIEGHAMYLGLRVHFRMDRKVLEWLQPYLRTDFGWMWAHARFSSNVDLPAMSDWDSNGFIYLGLGLQITVPVAFIREKLRIRATKQFSIGFSYEFGYFQPGPINLKLRQGKVGGGDVEPIPVEGFSMGTLDMRGITHSFGAVVTF